MTAGELTQEVLAKLREEFFSSDKNRLALNVCSRWTFRRMLGCFIPCVFLGLTPLKRACKGAV
jgi:hypothetical protein